MTGKAGRSGGRRISARPDAQSGGRPPKDVSQKKINKYGKVTVRIDPMQQMVINATGAQQGSLQRLMLNFPGVPTVQDLPMYVVERFSAPTNMATLPVELLAPAVPWIEQAIAQCFNPVVKQALETLLAAIEQE